MHILGKLILHRRGVVMFVHIWGIRIVHSEWVARGWRKGELRGSERNPTWSAWMRAMKGGGYDVNKRAICRGDSTHGSSDDLYNESNFIFDDLENQELNCMYT
jgi:hypothetical protein